ncbi:MAG: aminotransferase class V-fold PLP-dependent enzyme [Cyanothece sp. SIO1E1]|nr:aminotransferase class V-fold PLP-dependent enzyme [Cyanothece sp. SIO1E1]
MVNREGMFKTSDYTSLLQQLEQFFAGTIQKKPITQHLDPEALRDQLQLELPAVGESIEQLQSHIATYLKYAVKTAHPLYFNQLWGGVDAPCLMADLITSATNTSMYTYEVAPVATLIEKQLITKLGSLVGFPQPEGQFTTGGSNGNLMALALARHQILPEIKRNGMANSPNLVALVSEESHYSFAKAVHLLGIGVEQLWKVPADEQGRLIVSEAERLIAQAKAQAALPFFIAGTAGTTVRGAFDPLEAIAAIAQREKLWFHVDGAWGAGVLLSTQHRHLMRGVEHADSVVWDAHKMMGMTLMCSVLLVKQRGTMLNTFSTHGTDYLFHAEEADPLDLGHSTMHCGRRVDALKLWLTWKHLGDDGWEARINHYFNLAAHAEAIIQAHESLDLVTPRHSLNLCFQYRPQDPQYDANELTLQIRQVLLEEGIAMVNYAQIAGKVVFRLVLCNNQSSAADIDDFFDALVAVGRRLEGQ